MKLAELIKQERFASKAHEALLSIIVTSNWIMGELTSAMAPYGITPAQYNVLRILHGAYPQTMTCSDIGERLLDRTPDVTRLLNRLSKSGMIRRERSDIDRRVVEVVITEAGIDLLIRMRQDVDRLQAHLTRHLSNDEQHQLVELLERMRTDQIL